jgi:hypothetical protein
MAMFHLPAAAGKEAFARRASTEAGRTSGPSDHLGLGVGLDLPSRTFSDRPNLLYNYLVNAPALARSRVPLATVCRRAN